MIQIPDDPKILAPELRRAHLRREGGLRFTNDDLIDRTYIEDVVVRWEKIAELFIKIAKQKWEQH